MSDSQPTLFDLGQSGAVLIDEQGADLLTQIEEAQYSELKAKEIAPAKLSHTISAFANTDGGDLYIGIAEQILGGNVKKREWSGFPDVESAAGHLQAFERAFPLGRDFSYEFLRCASRPGLVLHVQVNRTQGVIRGTDGKAYVRRGASNFPQDTPEQLRRLEFTKGVISFEGNSVPAAKESIINSPITKKFVDYVVPRVQPEAWLKKQQLIVNEMPTVVGVLLFSDEPQAVLPKRCGIKVYRYKTQDEAGFRDVLSFIPITVEGYLYDQIKKAVEVTIQEIEKIKHMGPKGLENITYPPETLHEIITNAVIHRDYSIADDAHLSVRQLGPVSRFDAVGSFAAALLGGALDVATVKVKVEPVGATAFADRHVLSPTSRSSFEVCSKSRMYLRLIALNSGDCC